MQQTRHQSRKLYAWVVAQRTSQTRIRAGFHIPPKTWPQNALCKIQTVCLKCCVSA
jgi:hypothetical protein